MDQFRPHIDLLKKEFQTRYAKNASYSLRAFARDLGLSAAMVSQVLSGKKGLSEKSALQITRKLGLKGSEAESILHHVVASHARSHSKRQAAQQTLKELKSKKESSRVLHRKELTVANSWQHYAILGLLEMQRQVKAPEWFAKKLAMNIVIVRQRLKELEELGWIEKVGASYRLSFTSAQSTFDLPSKDIQALHSGFLVKANEALYSQNVDEREFLNMTLAFRREDLEEARKSLRQFQQKFADTFYRSEDLKDCVYQFSFQFFRLDKKEFPNV